MAELGGGLVPRPSPAERVVSVIASSGPVRPVGALPEERSERDEGRRRPGAGGRGTSGLTTGIQPVAKPGVEACTVLSRAETENSLWSWSPAHERTARRPTTTSQSVVEAHLDTRASITLPSTRLRRPRATDQADRNYAICRHFVSGANRDRTGDLLLAKQALSQLSYGPAAVESTAAPGEPRRAGSDGSGADVRS